MSARPHSRRKFAAALAAVSAGFARGPARAAESYTLRLTMPEAASSTYGLASLRFAAAVGRRSNDQVKIEVYPDGQIAKQNESIDGLTSGVVDFAVVSTAFLTPLLPHFAIFDMPFLFEDLSGGYRVLDGPIGNDLFAELDGKGIAGLAWGAGFFKELDMVSKIVTVPEDMKGMRVRVLPGAIYNATYQALGAVPLTIDLSETMVALSQHTIDGIDVSLDAFTAGKYYTLCKHVAMSNHVFTMSPLLGSKRKLGTLPVPLQRIVSEEARAVVPYWRSVSVSQTGESIEVLKRNGVAFTQVRYPAFRRAVEPVYATYAPRFGDLIDRIGRTARP